MEIKARAKYLRISPRKIRPLTKGLRGLDPALAIKKLSFSSHKGAEYLVKLLKQAIANATNVHRVDQNDLIIDRIEVGDAHGYSYKRTDRSHGARFNRGIIIKRSAHISLTLKSLTGTKTKLNDAGGPTMGVNKKAKNNKDEPVGTTGAVNKEKGKVHNGSKS